MRRGRVEYNNNMDKLMFKTVKMTKKTVLGLHKLALAGFGMGYRIHGDIDRIKEELKTKEGKLVLKKVVASGIVASMLGGFAVGIAEVSKHIPDASAAIVEETKDLDLDNRYKKYDVDINNKENQDSITEETADNVVAILHNADGSTYSNQVLEATGKNLEQSGVDHVYVNDDEELIKAVKNVNAEGAKTSVISIENGKNDYNQTLISSKYVATSDESNASKELAQSIVEEDPNRLYTASGVASNIVESERTSGIAQNAINQSNINNMHNGIPLENVDTLITVRPSSQDVYNPEQLGSEIATGIEDYYNQNKEYNIRRL